jgi:hypothetical protein
VLCFPCLLGILTVSFSTVLEGAGGGKGLLEVVDDVINVFCADGNTNKILYRVRQMPIT